MDALRTLAAAVLIGALVGLLINAALEPADAHQRSRYTTPCQAEDGPGPCFWDAGRRGNGRGYSYWIRADGCTVYLDGRKATRCD